jgi:hypothetical protein
MATQPSNLEGASSHRQVVYLLLLFGFLSLFYETAFQSAFENYRIKERKKHLFADVCCSHPTSNQSYGDSPVSHL